MVSKAADRFGSSPIVHIFFILMLMIGTTFGLLVCAASFILIRPFSKSFFRRATGFVTHIFAIYLVFIISWSGSKIYLYASKEEIEAYKAETKVLITNHYGEVDWVFLMALNEMLGLVSGTKSVLKRETFFVPIIGWISWFAEWIDVKRSFIEDKPVIERKVGNLLTFPFPVTLLFFAEGTRSTPEKQEASAKFAKENGLTPLKHLLTPRTKGFTTLLPILRARTKSIFDATWMFTNGVCPSLRDLLNKRANSMDMHIFLKRIAIEEIPADETEAAQWLHNAFIEKDQRIEQFLVKGCFEGERWLVKPWWSVYVGFSLTFIATLTIVYKLLCYVISNQAWGVFVGIVLLFALPYGFLRIANKAMTVKT